MMENVVACPEGPMPFRTEFVPIRFALLLWNCVRQVHFISENRFLYPSH